MKECSKCKEVKELTEFSKDKYRKDNLCTQCKECRKEYNSNPDVFIRQKKLQKEWCLKNKENIAIKKKQYALENKERLKEYAKEYYSKPKNKAKAREYYNTPVQKRKTREYQKEYQKIYYGKRENKDRVNERAKERRKTEPLFNLKKILRARTRQAFKSKGWKKNSKTMEILGVSVEIAKAHLERQFTKGMTWDNQGEWHIDHIIPLASANTEEELRKLCHYTNLQPLWAEDNLSKSDKIVETQVKLRI